MRRLMMCNLLFSFLFFVGSSASLAQDPPTSAPDVPARQELYPQGVISIPVDENFSKYIFVVGKKEKTLWVLERSGERFYLVDKFDSDMGAKPGDKQKENDSRTPTGIYFLQTRLGQPQIPFSLYGSQAFTTDYPNVFDKREAKTGHGIWLHAVPDSVPLTRGSRGCVVVRNKIIQKLGEWIKLGQTPLVIYDEVQFVSFEKHEEIKKRYLEFFEKWRSTWEAQDVDSYIRFYDQTFQNDQMNYKKWYRHKSKLKSLYSTIKVDLSSPLILSNKDQVVMRTLQKYKSNLHEDFGEKTIHAKESEKDGLFGFKIIREDWAERPLSPTVQSSAQQGPVNNSTH